MRAAPLLGVIVLASALLAARAAAQPRDPTGAAELFRQGRVALAEKSYAVACAKFSESNRLDPHVGTLISLAECEEATNTLAAARQHWQQGGDLARAQGDERAAFCDQRFASIDPRVPRLTIKLAEGAPSGSRVEKDGVDVGAASLGAALPVEIGGHALRALAPDFEPKTFTVELSEGEAREIIVAPGPPVPPPKPDEPKPLATPDRPPPRPSTAAPPGGTPPLRVAAYVGVGLGAAGLVVGGVFGLVALNGQHPDGCVGDVCNATGASARRSAIAAGNVSTIAFIAGGALAATGIVLWLSTPSRSARIAVSASTLQGAAPMVRLEGTF